MFPAPSDVHAARMPNLSALPDTITNGTYVAYTKAFADYPANAGWSMALHIAGKSKLSKNAVTSGASFVVTLATSDTDDLEPGQYQWVERVTNGAEVYDAACGQLIVKPNLATAAPGALQTWEEKTLAVVEAALSGSLTSDIETYQIHGRSVSRMSRSELLRIRNALKVSIQRQRNGGRIGQNFRTRFTRS